MSGKRRQPPRAKVIDFQQVGADIIPDLGCGILLLTPKSTFVLLLHKPRP